MVISTSPVKALQYALQLQVNATAAGAAALAEHALQILQAAGWKPASLEQEPEAVPGTVESRDFP